MDRKPRPHVDLKHYRRLRDVLRGHQNAAVKTVPRTAFRRWAKAFGLAEGDRLVLKSEGELTILFDFLVYHHRQRGSTLVQRYLAKLPPSDDPDEELVRQAMGSPRFSVYQIEQVRRSVGVVVRDLARGGSLFVVDEALSTSAKRGQFFAFRLLPLPDYWMTSGAGFPLSPGLVRTVKRLLLPMLKRARGASAASRLTPQVEDELAATVTEAAMSEGTTGDVEFK